MRFVGLLLWPAALALGIAAETAAFRWDEPERWLPDLAVGLTFIACGLLAWNHSRGPAALLAATGVTWFLGNFSADLLYLHRGPLVHLIVAYAGWRPRSRLDLAIAAVGYVAAIVTPVWQSEVTSLVLAAALVAVAARGYAVAAGPARRERLVALQAALAVGAALVAGATLLGTIPAVHVYEAVLVAVAAWLFARLRDQATSVVADLVVELGEARSGTLRDRLARALGDRTLMVGYWSREAGAYLDDAGDTLALPEPGSGRTATRVEREGMPFAVLVHDEVVLRDPGLVAAVASATRLSASNVALRAEVYGQAQELVASRRRLLAAADDERRLLEARLREGPQRRLEDLAQALPPQGGERLERARIQVTRTLDDLQELARGLHPRELVEAGLPGALASLAERALVPVRLEVGAGRLSDELEATVYFMCAEALANVAKYASASSARIEVAASDSRVRVVDRRRRDRRRGPGPRHGAPGHGRPRRSRRRRADRDQPAGRWDAPRRRHPARRRGALTLLGVADPVPPVGGPSLHVRQGIGRAGLQHIHVEVALRQSS